MRILVVEDTKDMNLLIVKTLKKAGYTVDGCYDGEEAKLHLLGAQYDAILLDIMMPKLNGYDFLKYLREKGHETPVLFLTAKDAVADRVKGLDLGADDYIVKPFSIMEMVSRVKAVLRRSQPQQVSKLLKVGGLVVNLDEHTVVVDGKGAVRIEEDL